MRGPRRRLQSGEDFEFRKRVNVKDAPEEIWVNMHPRAGYAYRSKQDSIEANATDALSVAVPYIRADLVPKVKPARWKWMVKQGRNVYAYKRGSDGSIEGQPGADCAHDFGSKEAAQEFVAKNWGRVVKRKVRG